MKRFNSILLFSLLFQLIYAQNPFPEKFPVFVDDVVPRVDILLPQDSLNILFAPGNEGSDYHWRATFVFGNGSIKDTVENVGFRFRGNTSRLASKKSFKVSFNTYEPGRKFYGLEKLNLNGEHNDPSIFRSKLSWDLLRELDVPAPRSNHVALYINDQYYGLYINVEHIDEEFVNERFGNNDGNLYKCLFPADLIYLGPSQTPYKGVQADRRAYELQTNKQEDDYSDLVRFIDVLNNTPIDDLPCELEKVFNVDSYLRALIYDIFGANWDGPIFNKNNFYLYHNLETGQFEYIPFDLDNTFGIDWFIDDLATRDIYDWAHPSEPRPLYDRIMAVPEYRDRFTYYFRQFLDNTANIDVLLPYIERIRDMIAPYAESDDFRRRDYGFSFESFLNSYYERLVTSHVRYGIIPYLVEREQSAREQLEVVDIIPIVRDIELEYPNAQGNVFASIEVEDDNGLNSVQFCYQLDDLERIECVELFDNGQNGDATAGDGIFSGEIAPYQSAQRLSYFIESKDSKEQISRFPRCEERSFQLIQNDLSLFINEVMASNETSIPDEAGEYDDWVEIYNGGTDAIWLGDKYLSDKTDNPDKWAFPDTSIAPGAFMLIWADEDSSQGPLHANFKLNREGEFVGIFDNEASDFALIDGISFEEQKVDTTYGRLPNGTGDFQFLLPTPAASNVDLVNIDEELAKSLDFRVFPNPFREDLTIRWNPISSSDLRAEIIDLTGRVVAKKKLNGAANEIHWVVPISGRGMYIVRLLAGNDVIAYGKVIRE